MPWDKQIFRVCVMEGRGGGALILLILNAVKDAHTLTCRLKFRNVSLCKPDPKFTTRCQPAPTKVSQ